MSVQQARLKAGVMDADAIRRSLQRIAHEIVERNRGVRDVVVVGIVSKGDVLATRLAGMLSGMGGCAVPAGRLDPTGHRDDLHLRPLHVEQARLRAPSELPPIADRVVVLVDDVIFRGRTIRAAMDALLEHGRPRAIQLAVLVDRGHRELPIRPDYDGKNVPTSESERIEVRLAEEDGVDAVVITA